MDNFDLESFLNRYAPEETEKKVDSAKGAKVQIESARQTLKPTEKVSDAWGVGLRNILAGD